MKRSVIECPLCQSDSQLFSRDKNRSYQRCSCCDLVFVPREQILSPELEKQRYQFHHNDAEDAGYRAYLQNIFDQCSPFLTKDDQGLDFGCGYSKFLSRLFSENGFKTDAFDLYFHPDEEIWGHDYNFIVMSEVIEHLHTPLETMLRLNKLLKKSGQIFIKTKFLPESENEFNNWFYKRDLTHVQFFNLASMNHLKIKLGFKSLLELSNDLYLMKD